METKRCMKCGAVLPITEFAEDKRSKDGYRRMCKACCGVHEDRTAKDYVARVTIKTGGNPKLSEFKPVELIMELRNRGYSGKLTFSKVIVV